MSGLARNAALPAVDEAASLVLFYLEGQTYALPLATVERVVRAAALTPLPGGPDVILGIIDIAGRVIPVFSLRRRFRLPDRPLGTADQFLIARSGQRVLALLIDEAAGVFRFDADALFSAEQLACGLETFEGVVRLPSGLVLIYDVARCLSLAEQRALDIALDEQRPHGS